MKRKRKVDSSKPGWWRMAKPCAACPWSNSPEGRALRETLRPGFVATTEAKLKRGEHFVCHATVNYSRRDRVSEKVCAGAIAWQAKRRIVADVVQIMQRLDVAFGRKEP